MSKIREAKKTFAIAYKIFTTLDDKPKRSAEYAERFSMSLSSVKTVVKKMNKLNCIVAVRGGGKNSGITRAPGVTTRDLFERFQVPFQEGEEFEKKMNEFVMLNFNKPIVCAVCEKKVPFVDRDWTCVDCSQLNRPLFEKKRLAKCGHYSAARYFQCEECKPTLEDNFTPDDFGCGLTLMV